MSATAETRQAIAQARQSAALRRRNLDSVQRSLGTEGALRRFRGEFFAGRDWSGARVGLYRALPEELDLRPLEPLLERAGARLWFPRVIPGPAPSLAWVAKPEGVGDFARGAYGIQEPLGEPDEPPPALDFIFVPGVAFGERGERIGRGAGYYDRALAAQPQADRLALAFEVQLSPALPQDAWDLPVDWIFTAERAIQTRRGKGA